MAAPYIAPSYKAKAFNCPHCEAYANQEWPGLVHKYRGHREQGPSLDVSVCYHCKNECYWHNSKIVYPYHSTAPMPSDDMPEDCKEDYLEARSISSLSPKGAAALLRLCLQKLMVHLGEPGKNINTDIQSLVNKGLPVSIQQAADICRVTGNEAVHPGLIDLNDKPELSLGLFELINIIINDRITTPNHISKTFQNLPPNALQGIANRK